MQKVIKPVARAWIFLIIPMLPIIVVGLYAIFTGLIFWGIAATIFSLFIILYNASIRLIISENDIKLYRYGFIVWNIPRYGLVVEDGKGGDFSLLPAYILVNEGMGVSRFLLKGWFPDEEIKSLSN